MGLDLDAWKTKVSEYLKPRAPLFKQAGADLIYGLLGASALRPILLTDDDPSETIIPVLDNPGTGLIINMVQGWKDKTDEVVAREILGATQANAELRQAMDAVKTMIRSMPYENRFSKNGTVDQGNFLYNFPSGFPQNLPCDQRISTWKRMS